MVSVPITEGRAPFAIPSVKEECFTYYKIFGDITSATKTPLICVHGGPSVGHDYLLCFAALWSEGVPVILYDQIGCGLSTHLRHTMGDESLWRESLFLDELNNLISHLGLGRYDVLGHSWGGCVSAAFASTRPDTLRRLILFSPVSSFTLQNERARELMNELPTHLKDAIVKHDLNQEYDKAHFQEACSCFYKKHAYRDEPFPGEALAKAFANNADDDTVQETMMGPSFSVTDGSLRDWTIVPRLAQIEIPVLLVNGEHDYVVSDAYATGLKDVRPVIIGGASHMPFLESAGKEKVMRLVIDFLAEP